MKTIYMSNLNSTIKSATADLKTATQALAHAKRELWTWQPGRPEHKAAADLKAALGTRIVHLKKQIADAQRLKKHPEVIRRNAIAASVWAAMDLVDLEHASGYQVLVNDSPKGKVDAYTDEELDWNYYAKSYGHPKKFYYPTVRVNPDWDETVQLCGLEIVGGMVTLSAKPLTKGHRDARDVAGRHEIAVYESEWVRKGRGFQIYLESGFLAVFRLPLGGVHGVPLPHRYGRGGWRHPQAGKPARLC
ncbi:hypothetical protein [Acidithiobacillus ferrooxidans]|uniref:Uncharacterized protein n=1 Tax=Acidithiobacillus ferrooxidans TaxID=920 RepID=A0A2W1KH87_ACIFR|nr:hypothetical protein [Acidithiobacillus ferrooxidans]MCR1342797.1 hypothetical protein [Acidithiobacillus ferrooxidans]PZD81785.1 hypothetical protein DN052_01540 [Acidithiobacillus ferrooxidans]QLK41917.1 hypothetical protein FE661_06925 [Acidithiobacillus ferrooxidans]QZT53882.1 hypothetical protein K7B00_06920 [Acidithiobacillus ferrooxidans]RRN85149.1 MAG: hypothetical protein EC577_05400 [Acidithiobacillus ferrooxidans]